MSRLIRASEDLLEMFGTRTEDGRLMTATWGEPVGHDAETDEYIYEPTFTASGEPALDLARRALGSFIWLGNNLHNSDSDTFRDMYRACLEDARTAYEAGARPGPVARVIP